MNENITTLKEDVCATVAAHVIRLDERIGREDSSGYESYGRIKDVLEQRQEAVKPLSKTLGSYWEEVVREDEATQAAMLREMETRAEVAIRQMIDLAATVDRAQRRLANAAAKKLGQMSMDELPEEPDEEIPAVDEETGEIVEPEEDLPAAEEVLGYDE